MRRPQAITRRDFIKGVIVGGVAVSSTGYLLRSTAASGQVAGRLVTLNVNGQQRRVDVIATIGGKLAHARPRDALEPGPALRAIP